jgi:hypothetical protein
MSPAHEDDAIEAFLLDLTHEAFGVGVQITARERTLKPASIEQRKRVDG